MRGPRIKNPFRFLGERRVEKSGERSVGDAILFDGWRADGKPGPVGWRGRVWDPVEFGGG